MPYYDLTELEEETIKINPNDNLCTVCGKPYKHMKHFYLENGMTMKCGIKCVDFITSHGSCRSLVEKIKKLKDELLELEYKLFCKKI